VFEGSNAPVEAGDEGAVLFMSTGTWPEWLRYQPMKGVFQRPCLARMRNWNGRWAKEDWGVHVTEVV